MPVQLSRRVARFNKRVNNPIQRQYAWLLPPWAIIVHRGRRSGRTYRTPVNAFRKGDTLAVTVLYGERSDWLLNLFARGAQVVRGGHTYELHEPQLLDPRTLDPRAREELPPAVRGLGRVSGKVLVARLGPPAPGFGRGPAAD